MWPVSTLFWVDRHRGDRSPPCLLGANHLRDLERDACLPVPTPQGSIGGIATMVHGHGRDGGKKYPVMIHAQLQQNVSIVCMLLQLADSKRIAKDSSRRLVTNYIISYFLINI